jgi:endonuclease/exonuclease/phosphatase family metal-dependent hydrolase
MFRKIVWLTNILAAAGLALSLLAAYVSPGKIWWLALFGLGFEILFVLNIFYVIYWIIGKNKKAILSMLLILLSIGRISSIVQLSFSSDKEDNFTKKGYIKVMSFNVRLFNLYNWFHNKETRKNIFEFLKKENPDIICFQEFYSSDKKNTAFNNEDTLITYLQTPFSQIDYTFTLRKTDHWGIATFSKFPIVGKDAIHFQAKGANTVIISDIKVGEDTIRLFNTHLQSIRFAWSDYKFIENLNKEDIEQDELKGGITILRRLKRAFVKRAMQVETLRDSMNASPYPVILCGDFNDTPSSYTYATLSSNMLDAFRESGQGSGKTYAGPFPSFRIDYIFHDKKIQSTAFKTFSEKLSDHYPISCFVKIMDK